MECGRPDLNRGISHVSDGCVWRIISPLRYQTTPRPHGSRCSIEADRRCVAAELSSARGSSAAHRDRPARIRTGDSWSKARWDCCFPTGLWSPRSDSNGDPLARDEARVRLRHGAVTAAYERTRAGDRQGMASPTGRIPKPDGTPEPVSAYGGGTTFG